MTLAEELAVSARRGLIPWPENCSLVTILRDGQVYTPDGEQLIEAGDELLFVAAADRVRVADPAGLEQHSA